MNQKIKYFTTLTLIIVAIYILSGCGETVMPVRSTAYNTESMLIEAKRHNFIMEQEAKKQTQLLRRILAKKFNSL